MYEGHIVYFQHIPTYIHIAFGFLVDSLCEIKGVVITFFFSFFFRRYIEKHALDEEDSH